MRFVNLGWMVALVNLNYFSLKWHPSYLKFSFTKASTLFASIAADFIFCLGGKFSFLEPHQSSPWKSVTCMEDPPPIRFELLTFCTGICLGFQLTDFFQFGESGVFLFYLV